MGRKLTPEERRERAKAPRKQTAGKRVYKPKGDAYCVAVNAKGEPCGRPPMHGQWVCQRHGGTARQNQAKAKERIAIAQDFASQGLLDMAADKSLDPRVRLKAYENLLDRGGTVKNSEVIVEMRRFEDLAANGKLGNAKEIEVDLDEGDD